MDESYPAMQYQGGGTLATRSDRPPSLKLRIEMAVKEAEERLAATTRAREILDKNPDLEELLNIMQRSHF